MAWYTLDAIAVKYRFAWNNELAHAWSVSYNYRNCIFFLNLQVWNDELSQVAQNYSERCVFEHNGERVSQQSTFSTVGENVALDAGGGAPDTNLYITLVTAWYDEAVDYDYSTNSCSDVCGHYTQVQAVAI